MSAFIKLMRDSEILDSMFEAKKFNEFILLTFIARRARRTHDEVSGLAVGECYIGDYEAYGLTRQKYRTALNNLKSWKIITIKATNKGTIARLVDSRVYDINAITDNHPDNHSPTNKQPTANQQATTNKECKEVKNEKNTTPKGEYVLPDWIDKTLFDEFLIIRKKLKAVNSERAIKNLIREIEKLSSGSPVIASALIEQAITHSWKSVYPLKEPIAPKAVGCAVNPYPKLERGY